MSFSIKDSRLKQHSYTARFDDSLFCARLSFRQLYVRSLSFSFSVLCQTVCLVLPELVKTEEQTVLGRKQTSTSQTKDRSSYGDLQLEVIDIGRKSFEKRWKMRVSHTEAYLDRLGSAHSDAAKTSASASSAREDDSRTEEKRTLSSRDPQKESEP